ncbi:retrotransposon protein, putative, ty1-copia subclass [Tanacetum coccineum]
MDGVVHTFKSRLIAKSFTQTYGVDYEETFSPVADIRAIRILIAIAAFYDYEIWQIDKASGSYVTFLILYVDDILIMGNNIPMLQDVKSYLGRCFAMKDLENLEKILHGEFQTWNYPKRGKSDGASTPDEKRRMSNVPYALAVGSIMYAVRCTRPGVAFAQNITSRFQHNPGELYWTTVKNILKYLRNTKDMFLVYGGDMKRELKVSYYIDAGYLTDVDAEYITAFDASKEAVWIRKFIFGLNVVPTIEEPITMYCDNTGAIAIANDHGVTKGA